VPLAFGLSLTTAMIVLGQWTRAHLNPAVTIGFVTAQRFPVRDLVPYIAAQVAGAVCGAALLAYIASGHPGFALAASEFVANGYGDHSPADYQFHSALAIEVAMSFVFVVANLAMASRRAAAPFAIGCCLILIYLVTMPVTNGAVNPARSTGTAVFVGDWALDQLWLFWAAPMVGGVAAGIVYPRLCAAQRVADPAVPERDKTA
jgi:aquaporin Z